MDFSILEDLLFQLQFNDSIRKISDLCGKMSINLLDSVVIKSLADQNLNDVLNLMDLFSQEDIKQLVNQWMIKSEVLGILLVYLGPEKLKHCVPELLVYLQDINWPAAGYVGIALRKMPADLMVPEIVQVIEKNHHDEIWVSWICSQLISALNQEDLLDLKQPLIEFIRDSKHEDSVEAAKVLIPILSLEEFNQLSLHFTKIFVDDPPAMEELSLWKAEYFKYHQITN